MTFDEVLSTCGVTPQTLTARQGDALDSSGYVLFPRLLEPSIVEGLRDALEQTFEDQTTGTRHVEIPIDMGSPFAGLLTHPTLLAGAWHVLRRPFLLFQLTGRDPLPGYGQQGLHTDWRMRVQTDPFVIVTALWLLDDFTGSNGATRLIPGSHRVTRPLPKEMQQPESHHPDEMIMEGQAGSLLLFNGHLWHSGTRNGSDASRRALQCQFVIREFAPPGVSDRFGPDGPGEMSPAVQVLLGRPDGTP